jgi:hypothetical protein
MEVQVPVTIWFSLVHLLNVSWLFIGLQDTFTINSLVDKEVLKVRQLFSITVVQYADEGF